MKYTIVLILFYSSSFCQSLDNRYIKELSTKYKYNNSYVVIPISEANKIIVTNYALHAYYLKFNADKTKDYQSFMKCILNGRITFDSSKVQSTSYETINEKVNICKEYKKWGLNYILKKYLDTKEGILRNKVANQETINGLIQIMFDNSYFITFSDYSGYYYFTL